MSQKDDSENEVWDYKPLKKKKKGLSANSTSSARKVARKTGGKVNASTVQSADPGIKTAGNRRCAAGDQADPSKDLDAQNEPPKAATHANGADDARDSSGDFCPMCQMPFSILVVQTQRWHIAECLDIPRDKCEGTDTHTTFIHSHGLQRGYI